MHLERLDLLLAPGDLGLLRRLSPFQLPRLLPVVLRGAGGAHQRAALVPRAPRPASALQVLELEVRRRQVASLQSENKMCNGNDRISDLRDRRPKTEPKNTPLLLYNNNVGSIVTCR